MKRVVLSEGKRDVSLVEQYCELVDSDVRVKTFVGEEVAHSRLKNEESEAIRNFLEPRNPYQVLAKSENGKPDLVKAFVKLANFLVSRDVEVCLLIDLDGTDLGDLIDELDTKVRSNYDGRDFAIERDSVLDRSDALVAARSCLRSGDDVVGTFEVLAFRSDLECAANIDSEDPWETQEDKLCEFIEDQHRSSPLRRVLQF